MKTIEFTKMHGAGNDYIYVNADLYDIQDPAAFAREWSRPHFGIGADGLVLISRSSCADFRMRMFNNDGSEGKMCGNASRCIAKYVYEKGLTDKTDISLETLSGIKHLSLEVVDSVVRRVKVDMGPALLASREEVATSNGSLKDVRIAVSEQEFRGCFVNVGNPHVVIFVPDVDAIDLETVGPQIEHHPLFPERINVEFVQKLPEGHLKMRVWERGSGITMACGTGACATGVAACIEAVGGNSNIVEMPGGELLIEWKGPDSHIYMTGSAETVFEGTIKI